MSSFQNAAPQSSQQQSSFSFTQGFLLGQLSVVLLIGAFIKFFIFGDPPSPANNAKSSRSDFPSHHRSISLSTADSPKRLKTKRSASQHVLRPTPRLTTASILNKTYYDVNAHPPESLDWFNVLIAQTIAQFRRDAQDAEAGGAEALLGSLSALLNAEGRKPDYVGEIKVTELSLGEEFPILSNCRIGPVDESAEQTRDKNAKMVDGATTAETESTGPRLQARMDVDLSDFITLGIDTTIHLNYPYPLTATLPVSLAVSIVRFSGTLSISFLPSTNQTSPPSASSSSYSTSPPPQTLAFSLLPDYRLDLHTTSQIGSRSRLQDMPKIGQLVDAQLRAWIAERCVEPRVQQVVLPSLWPRKGNVRMGGGNANSAGPGAGGAGGGAGHNASSYDAGTSVFTDDGSRSESRPGTGHSASVFADPIAMATPAGQQGNNVFEEGLRARRREYGHGPAHERGLSGDMPGSMPGSMPGTLVN